MENLTIVDLDRLTREGAARLPPFPSQSSPISPGQYVISHEDEAYVRAFDHQPQTGIWFKTPPLKSDTINRIRGLKLGAESYDQGFHQDEFCGNPTWLELSILENEHSMSPRRGLDGAELAWTSHPNRFRSNSYRWHEGPVFGRNREILEALKEGNVIAVRLGALVDPWGIHARNGYLILDVGDEYLDRPQGYRGSGLTEMRAIGETLRSYNNGFESSLYPSHAGGLSSSGFMERGIDRQGHRVLFFDGDGVRGLQTLRMLQSMMYKVYPGRKPCEVYSMIGGTGAGGLIALLLGRLRMGINECYDTYRELMRDSLEQGRPEKREPTDSLRFQGVFHNASTLERIRQIIRQRTGNADLRLFDETESTDSSYGIRRCKVFVLTVRNDSGNSRVPIFIRSYISRNESPFYPDIKVWEAARETLAAPYYGRQKRVGKHEILGASRATQNPLGWVVNEALGVFGASRGMCSFLNINTGALNSSYGSGAQINSYGELDESFAFEGEHEGMRGRFRGLADSLGRKLHHARDHWRPYVGGRYEDDTSDFDDECEGSHGRFHGGYVGHGRRPHHARRDWKSYGGEGWIDFPDDYETYGQFRREGGSFGQGLHRRHWRPSVGERWSDNEGCWVLKWVEMNPGDYRPMGSLMHPLRSRL